MSPVKPIQVLIVDDSLLFRQTLFTQLEKDPYIKVVGTAVDSYDALNKINAFAPDVVTLDVEMPKMNGIDFLKTLLPKHAVPVVVVSSLPINALDALDAGAVDYVSKPTINSPSALNGFIGELSTKIKIASMAKVKRSLFNSSQSMPKLCNAPNCVNNQIIAIGASTGGTEAILEVIQDLPETTPPIVIVQHMPPVFTQMYAQRLNKVCKIEVKEAQPGDRLSPGKAIIAAGENHLRLAKDSQGYYVKSEPGPKVSGHCPSVDVLFDSVADLAGPQAIGIILTGMGADGAKGLLKMRQAGAYTIGQDKDSSVVYGMPMVAFNIGGVVKQLPLNQIKHEIISYLNSLK